MTSLALDRTFECAPHAGRSLAWVLALSLNLALVLFALLPSAPPDLQLPALQSLQATVLPPPPPRLPPPAMPTLRVAERVLAPNMHVMVPQVTRMSLPALPDVVPVPQARTTTSRVDAAATGTAGGSAATIAYESATPPAYPLQALRAGTQGTVTLRVLVDRNGKPVEVLIARSSGSRLLDDAARAHVLAAWRFHPAMRDGRAIEAWAMVPVRFDLHRD
jgi:protein TonB